MNFRRRRRRSLTPQTIVDVRCHRSLKPQKTGSALQSLMPTKGIILEVARLFNTLRHATLL